MNAEDTAFILTEAAYKLELGCGRYDIDVYDVCDEYPSKSLKRINKELEKYDSDKYVMRATEVNCKYVSCYIKKKHK